MQVGDIYSHKDGLKFIEENHPDELEDVLDTINSLIAKDLLRKRSAEKTKPPLLLSPPAMNDAMKRHMCNLGWTEPAPNSKKGFREPRISIGRGAQFREMDGIKNKVGLEIQFGKYAFMGYDIFSKMPIFAKRGLIDCGIEVVVMPSLIPDMSTGVSSFSQIGTDMEERGVADLDVPTIIVGIEYSDAGYKAVAKKRKKYKLDPQKLIKCGKVDGPRRGTRPGPK